MNIFDFKFITKTQKQLLICNAAYSKITVFLHLEQAYS